MAEGESVTAARPEIKIGDAVCNTVHGSNAVDKEIGAFAEFVLTRPKTLLHTPYHGTVESAAILGLAALTNRTSLCGSLDLHRNFDGASPEKALTVLVEGDKLHV